MDFVNRRIQHRWSWKKAQKTLLKRRPDKNNYSDMDGTQGRMQQGAKGGLAVPEMLVKIIFVTR